MALLTTPLGLYALAAWAHRNVIEDGFIYLRIVHQVTEGHGPVFNVGERVEAFTSPLWLAVLSVGDLTTPVRLEWLAVLLGILATLAGVVLTMAGAIRLVRLFEPNVLVVPFGTVVLLSLTPMWFYASSGLETGLTYLWLGASFWLLTAWASSSEPMRWPVATVLGLGWLVRPELVVSSATFLVVVLVLQWNTDTWSRRLKLVFAGVALPLAYQLFRMGYYGALVANTAIVKEGTDLRVSRGWRYFVDFVRPYWLFVPFVIMLVGGWIPLATSLRKTRHSRAMWMLAAFLGAALVNAAYVVAIGGDYEHARLLLPALFALCAPIAVVPATRNFVAGLAVVPWALLACVTLRPPRDQLTSSFALPQAGQVTTDDRGWGPGGPQLTRVAGSDLVFQTGFARFAPARLTPARTVPIPTAAIDAVGVMPYAMGTQLHVLDLLGLADPFTARLDVPRHTTLLPFPGHEKPLPRPWIAARLFDPDTPVRAADVPGVDLGALIPTVSGPGFQQQIDFARATLRCPAIRDLERRATAPLTPSRFVSNLLESFSSTTLRIPPDPEAAFHKFCGTTDAASSRWSDIASPGMNPVRLVVVPRLIAERAATQVPSSRREPDRGTTKGHVLAVAGFI